MHDTIDSRIHFNILLFIRSICWGREMNRYHYYQDMHHAFHSGRLANKPKCWVTADVWVRQHTCTCYTRQVVLKVTETCISRTTRILDWKHVCSYYTREKVLVVSTTDVEEMIMKQEWKKEVGWWISQWWSAWIGRHVGWNVDLSMNAKSKTPLV